MVKKMVTIMVKEKSDLKTLLGAKDSVSLYTPRGEQFKEFMIVNNEHNTASKKTVPRHSKSGRTKELS